MEDDTLSSGHLQAINELQEIADANPTALEILRVGPVSDQGWLGISISLGTAGINDDTAAGAAGPRATMRTREPFDILVPHNFPLNHPFVVVSHDRFAHLPHVQWRRFLCLYISSTTEWHPSDGMFGFFDRLLLWIEGNYRML